MFGVFGSVDETNGRVCMFQADDLEWNAKLE